MIILWNSHTAMEVTALLNEAAAGAYVGRGLLFIYNFARAGSDWSS